ncbi:MAG: hypothetical protein KatS3mg068_2527 [Candidatus Sericytochromatia bacterium]|nr:MAG: hypothetical protein KatS3mg068_2527 [Candidatus Sericytochromatia bacterium]
MDSLLIINIIAGGFVGYITKTLAINMLFKEYTIIGGAEIIKDRVNLGISISQLVEEKLVKPSTLLEEFEKEPFRKSFENLIKHIIENTLNENINQFNELNDIKGFDKTLNNLKDFLLDNQEKIIDIGTSALFNNINIINILSKEQIDYIINFLIQILYEYISNNLEFLLENFSKEIGNKTIITFIDNELIDKLITNILNNDFSENICLYLDSLNTNFNLNSLIDKLSTSLKNKKISEILYYKNNSDINYHIISGLLNFINSNTGFNLIKEILLHTIQIIKSLDIPLSYFITEKIENKLLIFIEKNLPKIIEYLEEWLYINKIEIEKLINDAIDQHLESENPLKQILGIFFAQKLAERYKLVETTLEEIKHIAENTKLQLINVLNRFLDNIKISDIFTFLDSKLIDIEALTIAIIQLLNNYLPRFSKNIPNKLLDKKINDIPILKDFDLKEIFNKNIYPYLKEKVEEDLKKELKNSYIKSFLFKELQKIKNKNLSYFLNTNTYSLYKKLLLKNITKKEIWTSFSKNISKLIPNIIGNSKISNLISSNLKYELTRKFLELYKSKITNFLLALKNNKIKLLYKKSIDIYTNLCKNENFSKNLSETLINMMNKLIRDYKLLDGKIFIAVNESFLKFTDEELKQEMDSFMGKELQPIKLLGTFLGALIGVGMYFISFIPNYGQYVTGWWGLLSYSFVYGITEVGTNWLAIKMLFRPYYPKYFLGIKLPFTPGIFPKNKEALAKSMAKFIDQKLLSKENMIEILERYHNKWKEVIKDVVSKNDYEIINETIKKYARENYNDIAPVLIKLGLDEINKNKEVISKYIVEELKNINSNKIDFTSIKNNLNENIQSSNKFILNYLKNIIYNQNFDYSKNINEIISPEIIKILPNFLEILLEFFIETLLNKLNDKEFFKTILHLFENELKKKLDELLGKDLSELAKKQIINFINKTINDVSFQKIIFDLLEKYIVKELSSDIPVKYIFRGKIISMLVNESDFIINLLVNYLMNIAKNKKELLVKIIVSDIQKKGIVESFMIRFGGVKKDIQGVVNVLIDEKLNYYLNQKKDEIIIIFKRYVKNEISNIKLSDIGLDDKVLDFNNIKNLLYNKVLANKEFIEITNRLIEYLYTDITKNISINQILESFDIDISEEILENEISIIRNHLITNLQVNKENIIKDTKELLFNYFVNITKRNNVNSLLKNINKDEFYSSIENILNEIYKSQNFYEIKNKLLDEIFDILNKDISRIINFEVLENDLKIITELLTSSNNDNSNNFHNEIVENLKWLILDFIDILNKNVEIETKEFFENILVNSLVDSLRVNNREILTPIDFDSIVRREVYAMNPARIEAIFDFAKPIFRLLIWYGALGSIVGLGVGFFELFH